MNAVTLITGGARSGKSNHALTLTAGASTKLFIATAEPFDDEMRRRIKKHREERGAEFRTIEAPLDPAGAILRHGADADVAVLDCLTVWLGNLMHRYGETADAYPEVNDFLSCIATPPCPIIIVSNELGMGIVPEHPMSRRFRDMAGRLNQAVAACASNVTFMVSGIPLIVKESIK